MRWMMRKEIEKVWSMSQTLSLVCCLHAASQKLLCSGLPNPPQKKLWGWVWSKFMIFCSYCSYSISILVIFETNVHNLVIFGTKVHNLVIFGPKVDPKLKVAFLPLAHCHLPAGFKAEQIWRWWRWLIWRGYRRLVPFDMNRKQQSIQSTFQQKSLSPVGFKRCNKLKNIGHYFTKFAHGDNCTVRALTEFQATQV